ncbi:MAG TPA: carboxypeptidase-like regulatory domain-containing protein, partial [Vicinamibacterales bacterium]|nr:carboxypeptidase-like regulatory domain-containing protein [Vicinamibacterales bacterium]
MPTVAVMNPVDVDRPSGRRRSVADPGAVFTLCALIAMAACGGGSPSAPTPPAPPAATWSLSGTIRNEMNNEPLVGARVEILDGADQGRSATTGQDGRYLFASVRAGQFSIRAAAEGFDVQSRVVTLGADLVVDFVMRRPAPPGTGTAGILVQALSEAQVPGGTLDVSGLGVFTTEADGTFR